MGTIIRDHKKREIIRKYWEEYRKKEKIKFREDHNATRTRIKKQKKEKKKTYYEKWKEQKKLEFLENCNSKENTKIDNIHFSQKISQFWRDPELNGVGEFEVRISILDEGIRTNMVNGYPKDYKKS